MTASEIIHQRRPSPAARGVGDPSPLEERRAGQRAALYCRVSGVGQVDGHSLDAQVADGRAYSDRQGYRVVRIIRDVGSATGNDLDDRPGLQLVLALAERRAFDVLVVWDRSRWTRGPLGQLIEDDLASCGIRVEATTIGPRTRTDETELSDGIQDLFARWEARKITVRNTRGRLAAAEKGLWPTEAPFGYVKEVPNKASRLVLDPGPAAQLREAYQDYLRGATRVQLGIRMGCSMYTALNRLRCPAYKGMAVYKGIIVPCPGVVDADLWQQVQDAIVARRHVPVHRRPAYSRRESWLGPPQERRPGDGEPVGRPLGRLVRVQPAHAEEQGQPGQGPLVAPDHGRLEDERAQQAAARRVA